MYRCVWRREWTIVLINEWWFLFNHSMGFWTLIRTILWATFHKYWHILKWRFRRSETVSNYCRDRFVQCLPHIRHTLFRRWYSRFLLNRRRLWIKGSRLNVQAHLLLIPIVYLFVISIVLQDFLVHLRHRLLLNGWFDRFSRSLSSLKDWGAHGHGELHCTIRALIYVPPRRLRWKNSLRALLILWANLCVDEWIVLSVWECTILVL